MRCTRHRTNAPDIAALHWQLSSAMPVQVVQCPEEQAPSRRRAPPPRNFARNSIGRSFNKVRKRCNCNDLNSMFERVAGELRATLGVDSAAMCARAGHEAGGVKARPSCGEENPAEPGRASSRRAEPPISDTAPPVWRAPEGAAAVPVGGGAWPGNTQTPRPIGGRREACGAWPGFEPTRRAKLAARTASGRAGHAAAGDLSGKQATTAGFTRPRDGRPRA